MLTEKNITANHVFLSNFHVEYIEIPQKVCASLTIIEGDIVKYIIKICQIFAQRAIAPPSVSNQKFDTPLSTLDRTITIFVKFLINLTITA